LTGAPITRKNKPWRVLKEKYDQPRKEARPKKDDSFLFLETIHSSEKADAPSTQGERKSRPPSRKKKNSVPITTRGLHSREGRNMSFDKKTQTGVLGGQTAPQKDQEKPSEADPAAREKERKRTCTVLRKRRVRKSARLRHEEIKERQKNRVVTRRGKENHTQRAIPKVRYQTVVLPTKEYLMGKKKKWRRWPGEIVRRQRPLCLFEGARSRRRIPVCLGKSGFPANSKPQGRQTSEGRHHHCHQQEKSRQAAAPRKKRKGFCKKKGV